MKITLTLLGLTLSLAALTGCRTPGPPDVKPDGTEVVISRGHQHSKYCGHYRFGRRWFYVPKHRHGVNCGHEVIEGTWSLEIE